MEKPTWLTSIVLIGGAVSFWSSWLLMPGVGVTDAAKILNHKVLHRNTHVFSGNSADRTMSSVRLETSNWRLST